MKIYAPVKDANGVWASVRFINGVGETDNPILISWFQDHGYTLEDESHILRMETPKYDTIEIMGHTVELPESNQELDLEDMNPLELREWAKEHGFGGQIKNIRNKEKLLEIIRG